MLINNVTLLEEAHKWRHGHVGQEYLDDDAQSFVIKSIKKGVIKILNMLDVIYGRHLKGDLKHIQ